MQEDRYKSGIGLLLLGEFGLVIANICALELSLLALGPKDFNPSSEPCVETAKPSVVPHVCLDLSHVWVLMK